MPIVRHRAASQSTRTPPRLHETPRTAALEPHFPPWVEVALGSDAGWTDAGPGMRVAAAGPLMAIAVTIPQAAFVPAAELRAEVSSAYRGLKEWLSARGRVPIRFWNYIPQIGEPMGPALDRYMVFNAGRHDGFDGGPVATVASLRPWTATASAVGTDGSDLVIHCLASDTPGVPVENPRQTSSWRYSRRFGPLPPSFARAVVATVSGRSILLIAGTASIVGEESMHQGDVVSQLNETLRNIGAVINSARRVSGPAGRDACARLLHLRAYVTGDDVARRVRRRLAACCPRARTVEVLRAQICRPELLLEIEGVAEIQTDGL